MVCTSFTRRLAVALVVCARATADEIARAPRPRVRPPSGPGPHLSTSLLSPLLSVCRVAEEAPVRTGWTARALSTVAVPEAAAIIAGPLRSGVELLVRRGRHVALSRLRTWAWWVWPAECGPRRRRAVCQSLTSTRQWRARRRPPRCFGWGIRACRSPSSLSTPAGHACYGWPRRPAQSAGLFGCTSTRAAP